MNKYSSRRNDLLTVVLNDDSHIEYDNIFPKILSKNKKITVNVSLDKMPERRGGIGSMDNALTQDLPIYDLNYKLIEKKVNAPIIGGKSIKNHI